MLKIHEVFPGDIGGGVDSSWEQSMPNKVTLCNGRQGEWLEQLLIFQAAHGAVPAEEF